MAVSARPCRGHEEFAAISDFLYTLYKPDNRDGNWFQPIWEYAYTHPYFDDGAVDHIGIWEDDGVIVALALYESVLGEAFFAVCPGYEHVKPELLDHAERRLTGIDDSGACFLKAYVNDFDTVFEDVVRSREYTKRDDSHRPMSQFIIPDPFPSIPLPEGYRLASLAEDNDPVKVDRVLWRGFNHPGEPPDDNLEGRKKMQSGPHYRKDLNIVVVAPSGDFVAYAGLWFEPVNRFGYVEPVATDPDYRRIGLGTAAVLEGIRRCGELGAHVAYVGTAMPFYLAMGFQKLYTSNCWTRSF